MNPCCKPITAAALLLCGALLISAADAEEPAATPTPPAATQKKTAQGEAGEPRARARTADKAAELRSDRVDLGTTTVTGNRELPKVLYVVPWKKSDIGDFVGKPMNSLLDEVLAPVDREVFRREVGYYQSLHAEAGQAAAAASPPPAAASPQVEK
jgi:hypothetical protein